MTITRLFHTLDRCLDVGLPLETNEAARLEALTYQRGIKSLIATIIEVTDAPTNVVQLGDHIIQRRIAVAVAETRKKQIADARNCSQHVEVEIDDFGWPAYDDE